AIAAAFGKPFESAEVQALVKSLALTKVPRAKAAEPEDHLQAKKYGVELSFVDADFMKAKRVARYGNAPMLLIAATLYSGQQKQAADFSRYAGTLPDGTTFSDSPEGLHRKLGPASSTFEDEGIVYNRL